VLEAPLKTLDDDHLGACGGAAHRVHVARLRAKFSADKLPEPGIDTVRGVGYRFRDARDES